MWVWGWEARAFLGFPGKAWSWGSQNTLLLTPGGTDPGTGSALAPPLKLTSTAPLTPQHHPSDSPVVFSETPGYSRSQPVQCLTLVLQIDVCSIQRDNKHFHGYTGHLHFVFYYGQWFWPYAMLITLTGCKKKIPLYFHNTS